MTEKNLELERDRKIGSYLADRPRKCETRGFEPSARSSEERCNGSRERGDEEEMSSARKLDEKLKSPLLILSSFKEGRFLFSGFWRAL